MKPYQKTPILPCSEPLLPLLIEDFAFELPHPYQKLGAPYGDKSPFYLRQSVLERLKVAQTRLQFYYPHWRIQIFDAYRPIAVQQFMVDYSFQELLQVYGLTLEQLTPEKKQALLEQVYQFWAVPSTDFLTPPPHSTGAAIDVTIVDENQQPLEMGSPIDEISSRSFPDYFAEYSTPEGKQFHRYRQLLYEVMIFAGFERHPNEWWHFSYGDQMWAWLTNLKTQDTPVFAQYGRYE